MSGCSICGGVIAARGWCSKHWLRWRRHGSPTAEPYASMRGRIPKAAHAAIAADPSIVQRRNKAIKEAHSSADVKAKLSQIATERHADPAFKRRHREGTRRAVSEYWANLSPEKRTKRLKAWIEAGHEASADITISSLERIVSAELQRRGVFFIPQKFIGPFRVDFFLPGSRTILECDGDYWHSRPGAKEHDNQRDEFHALHGFRIVRLTESQITKDVVAAIDRAFPEFSIGWKAKRELVEA